jgi:gas vesicle protein
MAEYEDLPYIVIERRSGGVTPFLWGALLGAGAALLLAPRSGAETQEELREQARRLRMSAEDRVNEARDSVVGVVERTRDRVQDRIDAVREAVETGTQQAREAVNAGRHAAQETRQDLERRVAEAKSAFQDTGAGTERNAPILPPDGTPVAEVVVTEVYIEEDVPRPGPGLS